MISQVCGALRSKVGGGRYGLAFLLSLFSILSLSQTASAQSAAVTGLVMDPTGAVVRKAEVTLTNTQTNTAQHTATNSDGLYSLPFVQPGKYALAVEAPGFSRYEQTDITVSTAQNLALYVRLKIGDTSQSVTVDGSGAQINTTDASVSTVVDRQFVQNIPLNGRSFQSLMTSVPGVSVVPSKGEGYGGEVTVNGQRTEANYFTVDGVAANIGASPNVSPGFAGGMAGATPGETMLGTTQSLVSIDALEEFRATTSTYSAEYGRTPGGQFSFTTRSGTNQWHGSVFNYLRNDAMDANNTFNKRVDPVIARQAERQNDFGGTLGGPIRIPHLYDGRDRSFFFFSYEGLRLDTPHAAQTYTVPSSTFRQNAPASLQMFLNAFPVTTSPDLGDGLANYTAGYSAPSSLDSSSIRIDHTVNDKLKLFGRFADVPSSSSSRYAYNLSNTIATDGIVRTVTLGATSNFSPRLNNELRFNFSLGDQNLRYALDSFGGATPFGVTDVTGLGKSNQNWFYFAALYDLGAYIELLPESTRQRQINVTDAFTVATGRHNLKFGIDYRRLQNSESLPQNYEYGMFATSTQLKANAVSSAAIIGFSLAEAKPIYTNFSAYAQDDWKANRRLTLSFGLRWELNPPPTDADGHQPYTITTTDAATTAVAPVGTPLWKTTYGNFAPRLGIVWQAHDTPGYQTVVRVGSGLFYDLGNTTASQGYDGLGYSEQATYSGVAYPLTQSQIDSVSSVSVAPPYNEALYGYDPHLKLPYSWQWNAAVEQQLGERQTLTINYVGSLGRRLLTERFYYPQALGNLAFILSNGLYLIQNGANSNYHALQVKFQRNLSHGLQALASYTWSHGMDDESTNFLVYSLERGDSDNDIRNNFQAALTYDLPNHYNSRWTSMVFGKWSADTRVSARSALPVDILGPLALLPSGYATYFHPNYVPGQPFYVSDSSAPGGRRINYNAFISAPSGTEGDVGRNAGRGFDAVQADAAIHRDFGLTERVGLQFRAEAFNLFNHPIYGSIYNQLSNGSANFGRAYNTFNTQLGGLNSLYQTGGPRSLQVALRLHF